MVTFLNEIFGRRKIFSLRKFRAFQSIPAKLGIYGIPIRWVIMIKNGSHAIKLIKDKIKI
jgi:hypothetical protein